MVFTIVYGVVHWMLKHSRMHCMHNVLTYDSCIVNPTTFLKFINGRGSPQMPVLGIIMAVAFPIAFIMIFVLVVVVCRLKKTPSELY